MWSVGDAMTARTAHTHGFTLFELLVVIVIIGLVSSLALPRFTQALPGVELKRAARDLAATLRIARGDAIQTNGDVTVFLGRDQNVTPKNRRAAKWKLPDGLTLKTNAMTSVDGQAQLSFFPDGSSDGGLISLSRGERQFDVVVDWLTGGIKIKER